VTIAAIETRLLAAYEAGDHEAVAHAYAEAAEAAEAAGDIDRAAFFLTHAWIFALEAGDSIALDHRDKLALWGRVDGEAQ
jgi:hypothetical protein